MNVNTLLSLTGQALAALTIPGTIELGLLSLGSALYRPVPRKVSRKALPQLAIVIPAHNESGSILACLRSLQACKSFRELATIFVVADNCTDDTAQLAHDAGVQVLERSDDRLRGKGHALNFAFQRLVPLCFDAFVVVDADSSVHANFIVEFSTAFALGADAVQCPYLVDDPEQTPLLDIALRAFNLVRPRGRDHFGLSAGILGNGFALSRQVLERIPYTADSVVEDLEYHMHLVQAGIRVQHLSTTCVRGAMPQSGAGRATQRARWEGGRLRMAVEKGPRLIEKIQQGHWRSAELLLDLLTLPLAYHALLLTVALALPSSAGRGIAIAGLAVLLLHVAAAVKVGTSVASDLFTLATAPLYVLWKLRQIPLTLRASGRAAAWVRTARANEEATIA